MPLQNRVTPFGAIVAVPDRGRFTGNRGIIHDPLTRTLLRRRWASKSWLVCLCDYKGRRREVMAGRSWTELFFLDEATALAAGHRPCFFCRRADAEAFVAAWERGNDAPGLRAAEIDKVLHRERLDGRGKRLHPLAGPVAGLPDGAMIQVGTHACLVVRGRPLSWSFEGYQQPSDMSLAGAAILTPPSTVRALQAGYRPVLHPSAAN